MDRSDTCKSIYLFIYAFHMPLFLFISGLFHTDRNVVKKCIYYISAGFLLKIIDAVVSGMLGNPVSFVFLGGDGLFWFMFVLAIYTALLYVLKNQNKRYLLIMSVILSCFIGYDTAIGDYLYISRAVIFFPFYLLGTMMDGRQIVEFKAKKWLIPIAAAGLVLWVYLSFFQLDSVYIYRHLFTGRNPFSSDVAAYGPLVRLMCYFISVLTCFSLIILTPSKQMKWVTRMGARSVDVYFWHWNVYKILDCFFHVERLFDKGIWGKAGFLLSAVLVSILLSQGYIFSFPLKQVKAAVFKES